MDRKQPPRQVLIRTPIRKCYVVGQGLPSTHRSAFCARQGRSVNFDECVRCPRFESETSATEVSPSLFCRQDEPNAPIDERSSSAPIALVMAAHAVCVRPDVSIERVRALLIAPGTTIPVVDAARTLLGVVTARELTTTREDTFFRQAVTAEDVMAPRDLRLDERSSILDAAAFMTAKRLRSAVVVDRAEHVVAIVDDIALLHWVALHHL